MTLESMKKNLTEHPSETNMMMVNLQSMKRKLTEHPSASGIVLSRLCKKFNLGPEGKVPLAKIAKHIPRDDGFTFVAPIGYEHNVEYADGLPVEFFKKKNNTSKKLIFFLHGGAHLIPLPHFYRMMAKKFSIAGGDCDVCMINYGVAPEHPFPDALTDAVKGWDYVLSKGYKEEDILIMGDSAGGNLTLSLMLKLRDVGRKLPCTAICISPWADMSLRGESYVYNYLLDPMFGGSIRGKLKIDVKSFLEDMIEKFQDFDIFSFCIGQDRTNPYISPVYGDYHGFPPMLITAGGYELLRSDSETITEKLRKEGIDVTLFIANGMFHDFPLLGNFTPESAAAQNLIFDHINKYLKEV